MSDLLTSTDTAELLGVGATAVKRWADAGVLPCVRTAGGHRRFERPAVAAFRRAHQSEGALSEWDDWIDALAAGSDVHALLARLYDARYRLGAWHRVATSVGELLHEIGARWRRGNLTVVQEHIASAGLQRALATVVESIPLPGDAPRCLLATAEGDEHTLGLSLAELCLREAGWRAEWAGPRTRAQDVVQRLKTAPLHMVALSASSAMSDAGALRALVGKVGAACRAARVPLVLGGEGAWPELAERVTRISSWEAFHDYLSRLPRRSLPAPTRGGETAKRA